MRVLLVEDDCLLALSLREEVTAAGHTVLQLASSADSACEILESERHPDVALIDLDLRSIKGVGTLARRLRARRVASVLMTCDPRRAAEFRDAAVGMLIKPFLHRDAGAALEVAKTIIDGGDPPPPPIPCGLQLFH
jgi:DNA-binding response OmpR family regulator